MTLPPFDKFPVLSNDKIVLRSIEFSDMKDLIEISYYDAIQANTLTQAIDMQTKINADYANRNSIHWGIVDKFSQTIVGTCGYYRGFDKGKGELGCVMLPQFQGQGFMTLALSLAIDFGFQKLGLQHISAITNIQNEKAIRLLEKLNFKKVADLNNNAVHYDVYNNRFCAKSLD